MSSLSTAEIDRAAAACGIVYAAIGVLAYSHSVYPDAVALRWLVIKLPEVDQ